MDWDAKKTKYDKLLPLLNELKEQQEIIIDYDPHNYQREHRDSEIERIEGELDLVFARIVFGATAKFLWPYTKKSEK